MTAMTPTLGLAPEQVYAVLEAATRAPSVHNTQPWRFLIRPDRIELHAAPERALPATDPESRELRLSCGAALMNMRLTLQGFGVRPLVTLVPGPAAPRALAIVRHGGRTEPSQEIRRLLKAVPSRRTNRRPFADAGVPKTHQNLMIRAAELERSWLHVMSDHTERVALQGFVLRAHREQLANSAVQAELVAWTADSNRSGQGTAPRPAGPCPEPQDEWVLRDFLPVAAHDRVPGKDYEPDPFVAVLCSFYDGPLAEVQAGQAMQRVLLAATTVGLSASFISQPIEVRKVREDLRRSLRGTLFPQAVFRIGFGSPVPATPRRPVTELLVEPSSTSS